MEDLSVDNAQVATLVGEPYKGWKGGLRGGKTSEVFSEIERLYDGSPESVRLIQSKFGFSQSWVYELLYRRGLRLKRVYPKLWTKENEEKLIEFLGLYDRKTTAKKLGFTEKAIRSKIRRLGTTETMCRSEWYTASDVGIILDTWLDTISDRIKSGKLKASPYNDREDGHKHCWMVTRKDLRDYIIKYPGELEGHNVDFVVLVDILARVR